MAMRENRARGERWHRGTENLLDRGSPIESLPMNLTIACSSPSNNVRLFRVLILRQGIKRSLQNRKRNLLPRLLDAPCACQEALLDTFIIRERQLPISFHELTVYDNVLDVADVGMQDDRSDGIDPAKQAGTETVENDNVGFGANFDDADVVSAQGEPAVLRCEEEGLVDGHGVCGGDVPSGISWLAIKIQSEEYANATYLVNKTSS